MTHILYNGVEYVLSRQRSGIAELVDKEGRLLRVPASEPLISLPHTFHALVPNTPLFDQRPSTFVRDLQEARLRWLLDLPKRKTRKTSIDKSGAVKKPRAKGAKRSRQGAADLALDRLLGTLSNLKEQK